VEPKETDLKCEKCDKPLLMKNGKYGEFLACSGYPDCKYTKSTNKEYQPKPTGIKCPEKKCKGELVEKKSRRGKVFFGCGSYPDCKYALWNKPIKKPCPECNFPFLTEKTTKRKGTVHLCPNESCKFEESVSSLEN